MYAYMYICTKHTNHIQCCTHKREREGAHTKLVGNSTIALVPHTLSRTCVFTKIPMYHV